MFSTASKVGIKEAYGHTSGGAVVAVKRGLQNDGDSHSSRMSMNGAVSEPIGLESNVWMDSDASPG